MALIYGSFRSIQVLAARQSFLDIWTRGPMRVPTSSRRCSFSRLSRGFHTFPARRSLLTPEDKEVSLVDSPNNAGAKDYNKKPALHQQDDEQHTSTTTAGAKENQCNLKFEDQGTKKQRTKRNTPMRGRRWSADDVALLAQMRSEGKTSHEIGDALGRTSQSVNDAARVHGIAGERRRFSKDEDERIRAAVAANISWKQLHEEMPHRSIDTLYSRSRMLVSNERPWQAPGAPPSAVNRQTRSEDELLVKLRSERMGWTEISKQFPRPVYAGSLQKRYQLLVPKEEWVYMRSPRLWKEEEKVRLQALATAGWSAAMIAAELGRPIRQIYGQTSRLKNGIVDPSAPQPRYWPEQEVERLLELYESKQYTPREIAPMLNRSMLSVRHKLSRLGRLRTKARDAGKA